jgi:hypothetical protein
MFNIGARTLLLSGGATLASTSTSALAQFTGSTVNTADDFALITGIGSKVTLSGSLLSAGSTLNIGTNPALSADLLDINSGGQIVMNSANPVVQINGGNHSVGTADVTVNNTPNRLFNVVGTNTDPTTGLGTDQPIRGNGVNPAPFIDSFTNQQANNPVGSLLAATNVASIEVKRGTGDTVDGGIFAGNALRLDRALLEASAPIINLISAVASPTTLTTVGDALDISGSKVVSLGPLVALDKGLINVTNGALITLRNGSNVNVTGDLLSLINGSKINVVNGPLIRVDGIAVSGTNPAVSALNVSGALANFGGTGNNQIIVNNNIAPTATTSGIPVNGAGITIGAVAGGTTPIRNPNLGTVTVNGVNVGSGGAFTGSLIQTQNGGTARICSPSC